MISAKWFWLAALLVQNSTVFLVMKYSRTLKGAEYVVSTAVVVTELLKLVVSICVYIREELQTHGVSGIRLNLLLQNCFGADSGLINMLVPTTLYFLQNNLQYFALANLNVATFQVMYQLKILTTALCSVWLLNRSLSNVKWASLIILTVGVALVQLNESQSSKQESHQTYGGFLAVILACLTSGFAAVWFERIVKKTDQSIWLRNIQMSFLSFVIGLIFGVYIYDGDLVLKNGFFSGYNIYLWITIILQVIGGLVVAMVVKYADNILKGFATSLAIIVSAIASVFIFDFHISFLFFVGSILVLFGI